MVCPRVSVVLLAVFTVLAQERNVTRAATRLLLSQPAVSAALNRLRAIFNDELFVRRGSEMVPTARALTLALVEVGADADRGGEGHAEQQPRELPAGVEEEDRRPGVGRHSRTAVAQDGPGVGLGEPQLGGLCLHPESGSSSISSRCTMGSLKSWKRADWTYLTHLRERPF